MSRECLMVLALVVTGLAPLACRRKEQPAQAPTPAMTLRLGKGVTMKLARIPAGTFVMGSPDSETDRQDDEGPQRQVTIARPFHMGMHEVTQAQYEAVMGENPSHFEGPRNPVENVSWHDAVAFCQAVSRTTGKVVRLPTEAEWEYACRAGTTTPFHTGQTIRTDQANYNGNYVYGNGRKGVHRDRTVPVGSFRPNAWGLYDMHGNVYEWCSDWFGPYANDDSRDPKGPATGRSRVLRGGSYDSPVNSRSACRADSTPDCRRHYDGFRVVIEADHADSHAPTTSPRDRSRTSLPPTSSPKRSPPERSAAAPAAT